MAKSGSHGIEEKRKPAKKKNKGGKGIFIAIALVLVAVLCVAGVFLLLNKNEEDSTYIKSTEPATTESIVQEESQSQQDIHETLVVVTVSENVITYNGEELISALELEKRLSQEENPTLSLVNIDADTDIYNAVAKVLNKFGGSYELMDEQNTNPSIHQNTKTTTTR